MHFRAFNRAVLKLLLTNKRGIALDKRSMACSRYEYVKSYEQDDRILPNVWIVIRIDGKKFHKFANAHKFEKPNDENGEHANRIELQNKNKNK